MILINKLLVALLLLLIYMNVYANAFNSCHNLPEEANSDAIKKEFKRKNIPHVYMRTPRGKAFCVPKQYDKAVGEIKKKYNIKDISESK